jgi:hypothetical protein
MSGVPSSTGDARRFSNFSNFELPSPIISIPDEDENSDAAQYLSYVTQMEKFRAHYTGTQGSLLLVQSVFSMMMVIFISCLASGKVDKGATCPDDGTCTMYVPILLTLQDLISTYILTNTFFP